MSSSPLTFKLASRIHTNNSYPLADLSSSPLRNQQDVFNSQPNPFLETPPRPPNTSVIAPGPSGRSRVGLGVSISTLMSRERENEWREDVDKPLVSIVTFFNQNCVVCFLEGKPQYCDHLLENCPSKIFTKTNNAFYIFRTGLDFPTKMCYGCGLHTGVGFYFILIIQR